MSTETYTPDQLRVGSGPVNVRQVKVGDSQSLSLGVILQRTLAAAIAADEGNTGDGAAGAVTVGDKAKVGAYTCVCTAEASNAGTFAVYDPAGNRLEDLTVAVAYDNGHFGVTIADGAEDFDVGDTFTVTVTDSGEVEPYADADGDAYFAGVLAEDVDASAADAYGDAFTAGRIRREAVSLAAGVTLNTAIEDLLGRHGLYLVAAND